MNSARNGVWTVNFAALVILVLVETSALVYLIYLCWPREVDLVEEIRIDCPRARSECGHLWGVVRSSEGSTVMSRELDTRFPENDFSKHYLLYSHGRRILAVRYQLISKYLYWIRSPIGLVDYTNPDGAEHTMFIYRIDRVYIHSYEP